MLDTPFALTDLNFGNVIGGYGSGDAALASLRCFLETHGPRASRDLSLMQITEDDQLVVAMQDDLERLVRDSALGVVRSPI